MGEPDMANKFHNPATVSKAGKYSLGCEVPAGARLLVVSGQVGVDGKGKLQDGIEKQCDQVFKNIGQVLKAGGMGFKDVVKITVFLTDSRFIPTYRTVRDKYFPAEPYAASTLLVIAGLADPAMLVEVEAIAAK
jgi:enamine deaminase RidA (YjgF/YER057c/UK114 family)